jgi:hypothetical protein
MFLNGLQNFSRFNLDLIFFHPAKFFLANHGKKIKLQEKYKVWNSAPSGATINHSGAGPSIIFAYRQITREPDVLGVARVNFRQKIIIESNVSLRHRC